MKSWVLALVIFGLSACSTPDRQAPIEDRSVGRSAPSSTNGPVVAAPTTPPPTSTAPVTTTASPVIVPQNDKPGFHTVRSGETLYSIALAYGRDYRQLVAWNQLPDAGMIKVGQVLRVAPPEGEAAVVQTAPVVAAGNVPSRPLGNSSSGTAAPISTATVTAAGAQPPSANPAPSPSSTAPVSPVVAPVAASIPWAWPSTGSLVERFDETRNKGIDLAGKAGDPVLAAAEGKVVYVGNGLRGYGNLVIVKHNDDFISAYAHNSKLLVQLNDNVKRGQRIAEMGNTDADRVKLHFEIRRAGKPEDPLKYLPERK